MGAYDESWAPMSRVEKRFYFQVEDFGVSRR